MHLNHRANQIHATNFSLPRSRSKVNHLNDRFVMLFFNGLILEW